MKCVKSGHEELDVDAADFDVKHLDVDKMKALILDCVAALSIVQQEVVGQEQPSILRVDEQSLVKATQAASDKVFKASLLTMATAMLHDGTKPHEQRKSLDRLLRAFPDGSKQVDGRNWLPLHWAAVIDEKCVTEGEVKVIYANDPMALQRYHLQSMDDMGFTPAHLLCTREMTNRNMSLVHHFSICNEQAFTMSASYSNRGDVSLYSFSALHAACCHGQLTEELLKHLLQLDSSQTKKRCSVYGFTPMGHLCNSSSCNDRLIGCLLEVDSSVEVVVSGILGCLKSTDCIYVLERVDMLLKANPEAAKYRDSNGMNLLHLVSYQVNLPSYSSHLCIDIMQRILAIHKDAIREVSSSGRLPVYNASLRSTVEVMEFLLGLYPESASVVTATSLNLLHLAAYDIVNTISVIEAKVRFLCTRYPAMLLQRDDNGGTPLHSAIYFENIPAMQILCEAGGQELARLPVAHPTDDNYWSNGWLPLHFLISDNAISLRGSLLSKEADCFRMFLRWYPEAAGIEGVVYKKTPYQLAMDKNLPPYYRRLLLRAAPDLNPAELHRLNYAERRMAMFLAFRARTSNIDPPFLARLRCAKKDLVKYIMSFL